MSPSSIVAVALLLVPAVHAAGPLPPPTPTTTSPPPSPPPPPVTATGTQPTQEPGTGSPPDAAAAPLDALGLGPVVAAARHGDALYLALQRGGVAVVDVTDPAAPLLVRRLLVDRVVTRLIVDDGQLLALALREDVEAWSLEDPLAPVPRVPALPVVVGPSPAPPPPAAVAPPAAPAVGARGVVVDVTGGRVVFDGGAAAGFRVGQHVQVASQRLVDKPDLVAGGRSRQPSGEVTAVVAVEAVEAGRAMAVLGRGDVAAVGDVVEVTDAPLSERLFLPPRAPVSWRVGFHVRPFFGLESDGFPIGALVDGYVHWTPRDVPVAVFAELAPAAGALFAATAHYPVTAALGASYVTDWFEVGLGAGALVGNEGPCVPAADEPVPAGATEGFVCEVNTGFTFNQFLRLGALDGIHLQWSSSIFARAGGFVLGTGRGEFAVPVSSRVGLYAAGGVGENGWGFGEVGVRSMFGGTGGPGTVILSASLGAAAVFDGPGRLVTWSSEFGVVQTWEQESVSGPAVGFGMEWRL
jgi:hypothetical protein